MNNEQMALADSLNQEIELALSMIISGLTTNHIDYLKAKVKNYLANKIGILTPENEEFWYSLYPEDRK